MAARLGGADLTALQDKIKRDPEGYKDEFEMQRRHYRAELSVFELKPSQNSQEFAELVTFMGHVAACYPERMESFPIEIMGILERHYAILNHSLRKTLAQTLILLRNRRQIGAEKLLPLFFRLFRCHDKELRRLLFRHIVADVKNSNSKRQDEVLNKSVLNFLRQNLEHEEEHAAKISVAIIMEMYRRNVWRNARAVDVLAHAALHPSSKVMIASLNFFVGNDVDEEDSDDSDEEEDEQERILQSTNSAAGAAGPSKREIYAAYKKGTYSTKKKKQAKIKRIMLTVKKQARREALGEGRGGFIAIQLLHDPQGFAEKMFSRLTKGGETFETRLLLLKVISRIIGMHKSMLLQFYPFVQKYTMPQQREVTHILAALVQATHDMVPPDILEPVLRQLVNNFIHDRARPEVVQVGLKTVRELCARQPLIITEELLKDLTSYKTDRVKGVRMAARSLISLFRTLAPEMLSKKDRGRAAQENMKAMGSSGLRAFGDGNVHDRIPGAEYLEGKEEDSLDNESEEEAEISSEEASFKAEDGEVEIDIDTPESFELEGDSAGFGEDAGEQYEETPPSDINDIKEVKVTEVSHGRAVSQEGDVSSIRALKRKVMELRSIKETKRQEKKVPLEIGRILTPEDFAYMKRRRHEDMAASQMQKHGVTSLSKESDHGNVRLKNINEKRVTPDELAPSVRVRQEKEMRLAKVYEGREGREFGAAAKMRQKKEGGRSNKEKEKVKVLPMAARQRKAKARIRGKRQLQAIKKKQFGGKKR